MDYPYFLREDYLCTSTENVVEPGTIVSWLKTHIATGLLNGHPDTSIPNFGVAIGSDRRQH